MQPSPTVPTELPADIWRVIYVAAYAVTASIIIMMLYVGGEVIQPLALAALLSFVLAPVIRYLTKIGVGKTLAVILSVALALGVLSGLSFLMARQIASLAAEVPKYEQNLREKIQAIKAYAVTSGAMQKASDTLEDLKKELEKQKAAPANPSDPPPLAQLPASPAAPIPVELHSRPPAFFEQFSSVIEPLIKPIAQTALVILFLLFILLQREDLRDRALRLAGTADLQRSTLAMKDAGRKLSKFFLLQTAMNAGFGIVISIGLWIIGVPTPLLWGMLAGIMRFVPFIGSIIAAVFPIALAAAVDPGWYMVVATAVLFLITEPVAGHIVEPLVYGKNTGLSPLAVVVATIFWTLLWGPVGLLLATPLTLCLVVLGKYIPGLNLLHLLLGDEPALSPIERLYQRLMVGDVAEAVEQAEEQLEAQSLLKYQDGVVMKALGLAHIDTIENKIPIEHRARLANSTREFVAELDEQPITQEDSADPTARAERVLPVLELASIQAEYRASTILCIPARSDVDEAACHVLADLLSRHGLKAVTAPYEEGAAHRHFIFNSDEHRIVCISCFGADVSSAHARYIARRILKQSPTTKIVACYWSVLPEAAVKLGAASATSPIATTLHDAVAACQTIVSERAIKTEFDDGADGAGALPETVSPTIAQRDDQSTQVI